MEICSTHGKTSCICWLQWGHNFIVMEIHYPDSFSPGISSLQWGHNFIVMEMGSFQSMHIWISLCFNGAITLSLWKSQGRIRKQRCTRCFNGAITLSLWKLWFGSYPMFCHGLCFNGAITLSLWKLISIDFFLIMSRSFNGAITLSLWKFCIVFLTCPTDVNVTFASMGP